jgi:hypothetical protein
MSTSIKLVAQVICTKLVSLASAIPFKVISPSKAANEKLFASIFLFFNSRMPIKFLAVKPLKSTLSILSFMVAEIFLLITIIFLFYSEAFSELPSTALYKKSFTLMAGEVISASMHKF